MGSTIDGKALPPHLQARYGVRRTPWWAFAAIGLVIAGFVAALAYVAYNLVAPGVQPKLLAWKVEGRDRVDVTFEVRRSDQADVYCVIRAQDETRTDVGYAVVPLARGTTYVQETYPLRTIAPAYVVELLGCEAGQAPTRVPQPQFPPGVVPPEQPWTAPS